ncbi:MAG: hypothetical protein ACM3L8_05660 [Verrucomicrobiota bacterium]
MKGKLLATVLVASMCLAPLAAMAQDRQPDNGQLQYQKFQEARQQQWRRTAELRQQVLLERSELATMMVNPKTTEDALLKKQRELQESRAKLEKEQLLFLYRMKRQYPEIAESYGLTGYGMGMGPYGMGYGMMGGAYGMGPGMMGYGMGTGPCGMGYGMGYGMSGGYHMGPGMMGGSGQ